MRKQYHFRRGRLGWNAWDVDRLVELSAGLPVVEVPLDTIAELDSEFWYDHGYRPTVRSVAAHAKLIAEVDLEWPIILDFEGRVMDGMHRVARALIEERPTIRAVRFAHEIPPHFENCHPDDLPC